MNGATMSQLEAVAIAWCVIAPGREPAEPWRSTFAPLGELPRLALERSPEDAQRLALEALSLADWPKVGTVEQRFNVCVAAAVARACGLPVTPATIRACQSQDGIVDAAIGAMARGLI